MNVDDFYEEDIFISDELVRSFANFSKDENPIHFDDDAAKKHGFKSRIAHGMLSASFFSKIFANHFPGPGTIYLSQSLNFLAPIYINENVKFKLKVIDKKEGKNIFSVLTEVYSEDGHQKITGLAVIKTPIAN